jgi:lipopolysaccharide transport system ATP-binding protein
MDAVISLRSIGKEYRRGANALLYGALKETISNLLRFRLPQRASADRFWALREVSFEVGRGETIGIIGRNGAGKSTLLKILSQITEPTEGEAHLSGRVASLLEVGTGFHPELTGRENILLNGALLGMSRREIRAHFDEIVDFAEVADFIDTPVKRYSSGMYVRLAFAVAAHLVPEILIVDEVLSVGDAAFQRKCLGKMHDIAHEGRTVLMVSHNMTTITDLCTRVVWLASGRVAAIGPASTVIARYLSEGVESGFVWQPEGGKIGDFEYHSVAIEASTEQASDAFAANQPIRVIFDFTVHRPMQGRITMKVTREDGRVVLSSSSSDDSASMNQSWSVGRWRLRCTIPGNLLVPGQHYISATEPGAFAERHYDDVLTFTVSEQHSLAARDGRPGVIAPLLVWETV